VSAPDKGQADAIATGFQLASGDILGWLNSDDVYLPGTLQRVARLFALRPEVAVLTGYHVRLDEESRVTHVFRHGKESTLKASVGVVRVCQQTCFFRRSLYEKVGGLDRSLHYCMDADLWFRMFSAHATWGHIPAYLAGFRCHSAAKTTACPSGFVRERHLLARRYPRFFARPLTVRVGTLAYRTSHVLSGRAHSSCLDTVRWRGKDVETVFGPWRFPPR